MTKALLRLMALCLALSVFGALMPSMASAERFSFSQLPAPLRAVITERLRAQGLNPDLGTLTLGVTVDDCPRACNERVVGGMCYCSPTSNGCPTGSEETTLGGQPACRMRPTTASVSGGGMGPVRTLQMMTP